MMHPTSRKIAGVLIILIIVVASGGVSLFTLILSPGSAYLENPLRQDLWRAGYAHSGLISILSLVILKYVDDALLPWKWKQIVRWGPPIAAVLLPIAFFGSVAHYDATQPNALIYLAYVAFVILAISLVALGVGLLRK